MILTLSFFSKLRIDLFQDLSSKTLLIIYKNNTNYIIIFDEQSRTVSCYNCKTILSMLDIQTAKLNISLTKILTRAVSAEKYSFFANITHYYSFQKYIM